MAAPGGKVVVVDDTVGQVDGRPGRTVVGVEGVVSWLRTSDGGLVGTRLAALAPGYVWVVVRWCSSMMGVQ